MNEASRVEAGIRTPDRRLRVFVSSTVGEAGELAAERRAVVRAISALRLTPVLFEAGARPYPPRALYRAYLAQSDVFVGLYWQRYGRVEPGMEVSGLDEELQLALSGGLPRLLYVKTPAPEREPRLAELLARIKQEASDSYRYFRTPAELGQLVGDDLATLVSERFTASSQAVAPGSVLGRRPPIAALPTGTVTFLFTDIEGSTRLVQELGDRYPAVRQAYAAIMRQAIDEGGGVEVSTEGDSFFVAFASPVRAVEAAVAAQRALAAHHWAMELPLGVRMGLHTGEGTLGGDNYVGLEVHRAARIAEAAHGGQVLVSDATQVLVAHTLPQGVSLRDLGRHRLKDLARPEHLHDLVIQGLPTAFPPPRTLGARPRNLPVQLTSLVGREAEVAEVTRLLDRTRLVTLSGPGGVGKTRLALAVAERLGGRFDAGVVFVPLAGVTRPELVLAGIARALGADLGADFPLEALAERLGDDRWLLVLDNLEQVLEVAGDLQELLARGRGVTILVTSRTVLGLQAEQEYPVPPLPLPPASAAMTVAELIASPAVALFADRARAVRPGFALTQANAAAVVELCRRLEGLPLAIELAAARTRLLDPQALLGRLARSLDALGTGPVDLPERQHTLRTTVAWSVGLLEEDERSLLETVAIFVDGWTVEAAAEVASLDEDRALDLTEALARHSLIFLDRTELGPRPRMLETIRVFVAERLAARPDVADIGRRHADYYRALAEQADRPLRGASQSEWVERMQAEAGNLAAAVRWYLAHDPGPLPHLFRVLWPFWSQRDHLGEARSWIDQLLPGADALDPQARAELLWTVMVTAREVGDDTMALSARQRLAPLLEGIADPYLHAASQLAMAWTSPIVDDLDGALREASAALEEFRSQVEPLGTTSAGLTLGAVETTVGRYDDALRHLTEARDLAVRLDNAWLTATSQVLLGALALVQGRREDAQALLEEALELSLAARSTQLVTLCLAGFAQLAFVEGNAERAALLAGAAEGLRRRVGLRAWPSHRRAEAALMEQIRQVLEADHFDQVFAAGARLNQREAVATVRDQRGTSRRAP